MKKPDFVFPNGECYHKLEFPGDLLTILGAKSTCKDRWRQVLNEGRQDTQQAFVYLATCCFEKSASRDERRAFNTRCSQR